MRYADIDELGLYVFDDTSVGYVLDITRQYRKLWGTLDPTDRTLLTTVAATESGTASVLTIEHNWGLRTDQEWLAGVDFDLAFERPVYSLSEFHAGQTLPKHWSIRTRQTREFESEFSDVRPLWDTRRAEAVAAEALLTTHKDDVLRKMKYIEAATSISFAPQTTDAYRPGGTVRMTNEQLIAFVEFTQAQTK